jgi:acyl dehydratase
MDLSPAADTPIIENRTFDEIAIGQTASTTHTLTREDIELFAIVSGDVNPAQLDPAYAETDLFHRIVAHGMWGGAGGAAGAGRGGGAADEGLAAHR